MRFETTIPMAEPEVRSSGMAGLAGGAEIG